MKKEEQEKEIIELRKKELETEHNYIISMLFQIMGIIGATIVFLKYSGLLNLNNNNLFPFGIFVVIIFLYILWCVGQKEAYISDCYEDLYLAIKDNKIIDFRFMPSKWYNIWVYKRRFRKL